MSRRAARIVARLLGGLILGTLLVLTAAPAVSAHPLGNFTVNRYSALLIAADQVSIDHVVDLAEVPTAQLGDRIDDPAALARSQCDDATATLRLDVSGARVALSVTTSRASVRDGQAGLPVLRVECRLTAAMPAIQEVTTVDLVDSSLGSQIGWREVVVRGDGVTLLESDVSTETVSDRLSSYPADLLDSPPDVRAAHVLVTPGGPTASLPGMSATTPEPRGGAPDGGFSNLDDRAAELVQEPGMWVALLALLTAFGLGAAHALAPGHGKTVMAFYLSSRRERSVRAALSVGVTVTAAHTASVLVLGVIVTLASTVVPADLYPWLTIASGLLVLAVGVSLLRSVVRTGGHGHTHGHEHGHEHGHGHTHGHGHAHGHEYGHGHGDGAHHASERPATNEASGERSPLAVAVLAIDEPTARPAGSPAQDRLSLATLGLAGGLVPSPSALLLFLAALVADRPAFGVVLVVLFGAGMALTLAGAGLAATGLLTLIERAVSRRSRVSGAVRVLFAYGAATGVCAVGLGLVLRTAWTL